MKKNEGHEYVLKDLSFQILWLSSQIRIYLLIRLYKKINISVVEESLCHHYFFNLAEKN